MTDHLKLAVGAIKVAMKQHGLNEPVLPSSSVSTRIHRICCDPDGMQVQICNALEWTDAFLIPGTVTLADKGSLNTIVSICLD